MKTKSAKKMWDGVLGRLQLEVTRANFDTWLRETQGLAFEDGTFTVSTPSAFAAEWLEHRLHSLMEKTLTEVAGQELRLQIVVRPAGTNSRGAPSAHARGNNHGAEAFAQQPRLNPRYTFGSFIVGSCNRLAHAAALGVTEKPGSAYNPLFIYGGVGLGKTHLLHAIGYQVLERSLRAIYCSSEQFTNEFINAIRERKNEEFRARYRSVDLLLVDDIQFIAGKEQTQEEFFHTFNDLHGAGRQIVVSSDRHPKSMPLLEDRLRSRFEWGLIADIQPPDLETRIAILHTKAEQQQAVAGADVLEWVARKYQTNIRELEGSLNRIIAYSRLSREPISLDVATRALADLEVSGAPRRTVTPAMVLAAASAQFNLPEQALTGKKRDQRTAQARHITMYLLREETQLSLGAIGRILGGRDHTTVLHGCGKIEAEMNASATIRREVAQLRELIYSSPT